MAVRIAVTLFEVMLVNSFVAMAPISSNPPHIKCPYVGSIPYCFQAVRIRRVSPLSRGGVVVGGSRCAD